MPVADLKDEILRLAQQPVGPEPLTPPAERPMLGEPTDTDALKTEILRLASGPEPRGAMRTALAGFGEAVTGAPGKIAEGVGIATGSDALTEFGQSIAPTPDGVLPYVQPGEEGIAANVGRTIGSGATFAPLAALGGIPGALLVSGSAAAQAIPDAFYGAKANGADDDTAWKAALVSGIGQGALETVLGPERLIGKIAGAMAKADRATGGLGRELLTSAAGEGIEEASQSLWADMVAQDLYKVEPDEDWATRLSKASEQAAYGALGGGVLGSVALAAERYARGEGLPLPAIKDAPTPYADKPDRTPPVYDPIERDLTPDEESALEKWKADRGATRVDVVERPDMTEATELARKAGLDVLFVDDDGKGAKEGVTFNRSTALVPANADPATVGLAIATHEGVHGMPKSAREALRAALAGAEATKGPLEQAGKNYADRAEKEGVKLSKADLEEEATADLVAALSPVAQRVMRNPARAVALMNDKPGVMVKVLDFARKWAGKTTHAEMVAKELESLAEVQSALVKGMNGRQRVQAAGKIVEAFSKIGVAMKQPVKVKAKPAVNGETVRPGTDQTERTDQGEDYGNPRPDEMDPGLGAFQEPDPDAISTSQMRERILDIASVAGWKQPGRKMRVGEFPWTASHAFLENRPTLPNGEQVSMADIRRTARRMYEQRKPNEKDLLIGQWLADEAERSIRADRASNVGDPNEYGAVSDVTRYGQQDDFGAQESEPESNVIEPERRARDLSVSPIPEPSGSSADTGKADTYVGRRLIGGWTGAQLDAAISDRLAREDAALREQFPDKGDAWYARVADARRQARDPRNPEGDRAALMLRRAGVQPLPLDPGGYSTEAYMDARAQQRSGRPDSSRVDQGPRYSLASDAGARGEDVEAARKAWKEQGTDSPWFKRWFGQSKVVDGEGKPLVVYHGTPNGGFTEFEHKGKRDTGWFGSGFNFSEDRKSADMFRHTTSFAKTGRAHTYQVYLSIQNPLYTRDIDADFVERAIVELQARRASFGRAPLSAEKIESDLRAPMLSVIAGGNEILIAKEFKDAFGDLANFAAGMGYDGIYAGAEGGTWVAFRPEQIKSVNNRGTFSPANPDIRYSLGQQGKKYRYRMQYRPPGFDTLPSGVPFTTEPASKENPFGVAVYDKPLPFKDEEAYQLEPLDPNHPKNIRKTVEARRGRIYDALSERDTVEGQMNGRVYVLGPDTRRPDKMRLTSFDPDGTPTGHMELGEISDAMDEAARMGFEPKRSDVRFSLASDAGAQGEDVEAARKAWKEQGTESPWFKRWFRESWAVDRSLKPIRLFHATRSAGFNEFSKEKLGSYTGAQSAKKAFFFSDSPSVAETYPDGAHEVSARDRSTMPGAMGVSSSMEYRLPQAEAALERAQEATYEVGPVDGGFEVRITEIDQYGSEYSYDDGFVYETKVDAEDAGSDAIDALIAKAQAQVKKYEDRAAIEREEASAGSGTMPVYLSVQNPLVHDAGGGGYGDFSFTELLDDAIADGHDGVVIRNVRDAALGDEQSDIYAVFEPTQIKSATGNRGTFSPANPDIRYSLKSDIESVAADLSEPEGYQPAVASEEMPSRMVAKYVRAMNPVERKGVEEMMAEADAILADRGAREKLARRAMNHEALNEGEQIALQRIASLKATNAWRQGASMDNAVEAQFAFQQARTTAGRVLGNPALRDALQSPAERAMGLALSPSKQVAKAYKKAKTWQARRAIVEEEARKIERIRYSLAQKGFDPALIPDDYFKDPTFRNVWAESVADAKANGKWDWYIQYRRAAMLSGPITTIRNVTGNTSYVTYDRIARIWADAVIPGTGTSVEDARAYTRDLFAGIAQGWKDARAAYSAFYDASTEGTSLDEHATFRRGPIMVGLEAVGVRAQAAQDIFFRSVVGAAETRLRARQKARAEGGAAEDYMSDPDVLAMSKEDMERALFLDRDALTRSITGARDWLDEKARFPVGTTIVPFAATPTKIVQRGGETLLGPLGGYMRDREKWGGVLLGAGAWAAMVWAASMFDDDDGLPLITGSRARGGQGDFQDRTAPAYSIRIGDEYYSYQTIEPLSTALAAIADAVQSKDPMKSVSSFAAAAKDKSFFRSIETVYDAIVGAANGERGSDRAKQVARDLLWTPMIPNIVRAPVRAADETRRKELGNPLEAEDFLNAAVPTGDFGPPLRYDLWGRPAEKAGGSWVSRVLAPAMGTKDVEDVEKIDLLLADYNRKSDEDKFFSAPQVYVERNNIRRDWTEEEYSELTRDAGAQALTILRPWAANKTELTERDLKHISDVLSKTRARKVEELLRR